MLLRHMLLSSHQQPITWKAEKEIDPSKSNIQHERNSPFVEQNTWSSSPETPVIYAFFLDGPG